MLDRLRLTLNALDQALFRLHFKESEIFLTNFLKLWNSWWDVGLHLKLRGSEEWAAASIMQRKPHLHLQVTPCGTSYPEQTAYWKQIFTQAWLTTAGKPSKEFPFKWGWEFISNWFVFEWKHGRVTACLKHDRHHVWVIFCRHSQKTEFVFFSSGCSFNFC